MPKSTRLSKKSEPVERAHSDFSASASERWLRLCPGSVKLSRGLESEDSFASLQGTAAHELAALALRERVCPTKIRFKGKIGDEHLEFIDDEMRFEVKKYFDFVMPYFDKGEVYIETKFDLSWLHKKHLIHMSKVPKGDFAPKGKFTMFGTGDVVVVEPWGDIHVIDLKYGKGKIVEAVDNSQLAFYGIGGADVGQWDFDKIHMHIHQPRRDHFPQWTIDKAGLGIWAQRFTEGVEIAASENAPLNPGSHCGFCPAKHDCPARHESNDRQLQEHFSDVPKSTNPAKLTPVQVGQILDKSKVIEDWLKSVRAHAIKLLERDVAVPGYKLVSKRGERVWKDHTVVEKLCKKHGYDEAFTLPELKSPAQIEKILGKKFVGQHAVMVAGAGHTIAKDDDRREKTVAQIDLDFGDWKE